MTLCKYYNYDFDYVIKTYTPYQFNYFYNSIPEVEKIFNPTEDKTKKVTVDNSLSKEDKKAQINMAKNFLDNLNK